MFFVTAALVVLVSEATGRRIMGGAESFYPCLPVFLIGSMGACLDYALQKYRDQMEKGGKKFLLTALCVAVFIIVFFTIPYYYGKIFKPVNSPSTMPLIS